MHSGNICRGQPLLEKGHLILHVLLSLNFVSTASTIVAVFVIVIIISNYYFYNHITLILLIVISSII